MASPQRLPTLLQVSTYLFGVCLFSISFLVFLNSSVSFVITDIIGEKKGVGDAVGSLGFTDELVAIVACPAWGMVSDRLGLRQVVVIGYLLVGVALVIFVQPSNVYPQLLLARMLFALGGAACTTMVTATLPSISQARTKSKSDQSISRSQSDASEVTVTPANWSEHESDSPKTRKAWYRITGTRLAGLVGAFTGCGALIALTCFLPLPSYFQAHDQSPASALRTTYYIVGAIAFAVSVICFFGLRNLQGQENKGWHNLWLRVSQQPLVQDQKLLPYWQLFTQSIRAGAQPDIGLGYVGGFVARASSVGISLFIPLLVNNYFITSGRCKLDDSTFVKVECREAYILAAKLTGVSQLVALLLAPAFGYSSDSKRRLHIPLLFAAASGIVGYSALSFFVQSPDPASSQGTKLVYLWVSLIGASQIGAIVCSLGSISHGISNSPSTPKHQIQASNNIEDAPLLSDPSLAAEESSRPESPANTVLGGTSNLNNIQGSIAGTYSLAGGVAILFLTKVGGALFDSTSVAAPFVILLAFNVLLLFAVLGHAGLKGRGSRND